MDTTAIMAAKAALDLIKSETVLNKSSGALGMLFPYAGLKKKAVDVYVNDIQNSNLSPETKALMIMNFKKEMKQMLNKASIVNIAINSAKDETDFSEKSGVDEEWLERYMDAAGYVSNEEIQIIWGKILANEFERPGCTPPNMRRILSEVTPALAKAFSCICGMTAWFFPLNSNGDILGAFERIVVPYNGNEDALREVGVGFDLINELETLGLIRINTMTGYVSKGVTEDRLLISLDDDVYLIEKHEKNKIPIGNVLLTSAGEALRSIIKSDKTENFDSMVFAYLKSHNTTVVDQHEYVIETNGDDKTISRVSK